ncbi:aminotransferase class I/II-fold pyridoxal phosphate-dependent enzyme [Paenibacillus sp. PR3]|uniref:Aminotransferase class I/II-fold pyridoxal phosphate-dependent enzyme n=1 Tax=Paenibacillus terricola TaxID=2763503 RepID=A0ABR8MY36_9BACL|nr:aminotransferase class I/II-fold pyridoxal phosphate-dependent enzyme [Paenibacillus terricola]MBD3920236.1 aminotransferase class I/II-fold pyridoxal phosphate-dependent enzyme [Paenibacillus terricola]
MNQRIFLSPPHIGEAEAGFVAEAFESNWIAPLGPNVDAFEQELASYVGAQGAVALSSGTAAIHLALKLLGVSRGDFVFVSSLTFIASVNPVLYEGAEPVFIDADETTWNMSPRALQRALEDAKRAGKLPKAVIVVSLYGQSADMGAIAELCEHYGVPILEDAAESLGATYRGSASGTFGQFGIYSFNGNKIMTTSGGGMLVGQDLEALKLARFWATQSRDQALHYEHSQLGFNYRMSNVLAGIGRGQLQVLDSRIETRRAIFDRYAAAFSDTEGVSFMPEAAYGRSTRWLTAMTLDPKATGTTPEALVHALAEANIEARPVWKPMHLQPLLREYAYYPDLDIPLGSVSDQLFATGICLPSGSSLTLEQQNRVIDCIQSHLSDSHRLASMLAANGG